MNHIMSLGQWPAGLTMGAGSNIIEPSGIIINGDLTAYWQRDEARLFRDHYNRDDLRYTLYPGLGNHDYSNNAGMTPGTIFPYTTGRNGGEAGVGTGRIPVRTFGNSHKTERIVAGSARALIDALQVLKGTARR